MAPQSKKPCRLEMRGLSKTSAMNVWARTPPARRGRGDVSGRRGMEGERWDNTDEEWWRKRLRYVFGDCEERGVSQVEEGIAV